MKEFENNAYFWQKIDSLIMSGDFKLIYKKGEANKKYPALVYPCDYGHIITIDGETGNQMGVYRGTQGRDVNTIAICADILAKDVEIKVFMGLSEEEEEEVLHFLNCSEYQKSVVIRRGNSIPSWSVTE